MNNTQRTIVLILSIILAPILFVWGMDEHEEALAIGAPIVSVAIGIFVWSGRDKTAKPPN
jgi:hypothetical protein